MYSSTYFNSNCNGFETRDKLVWKSGCRNINTIRKHGIPKINISEKYPSSPLGFGCSPQKDTCDIFLEYIFRADCKYIHKKIGLF